jgi:hypothetical protein
MIRKAVSTAFDSDATLLPADRPLQVTAGAITGWLERGRHMAAEARRTNSPRLRIMARNHLLGIQQRIAEALRME